MFLDICKLTHDCRFDHDLASECFVALLGTGCPACLLPQWGEEERAGLGMS